VTRRAGRRPRTTILLGLETFERRQAMSATPLTAPSQPFLPPGLPAVVAIAPSAVAPALPVAVVPTLPDSLYGYASLLATPTAAAGYDFVSQAGPSLAGIDVGLVDVPLGATLELEVLGGLRFWDGRGQPAFTPVTGGVEINLESAGGDLRIGARTDRGPGQPSGSTRGTIDVAVSDGLPVARRIRVTIGSGGTRESFARAGAPAGLYAFSGLWSIRNAAGIRDSSPVTFVFALGGASRQARDAAVAAFATPAGHPAAIVAVATQVVQPEGPGQSFLRVNVQYSDPVIVTGRMPQLPIFFDGRMRLASVERGSTTAAVRSLSFVLVPTATERTAASVRIGEALRLQSGGGIRVAAGGAAMLSLPPEAFRSRAIGFDGVASVISSDIVKNTVWRSGRTYIIDGEIHVRSGVTLTIDDGVTVLIRNGYRPQRTLTASALIFASGSRLLAKTVTFGSADDQNRQTTITNNGGVFFLGTARSGSKDGVTVDTSAAAGRSSFVADLLVFDSLGRADPRYGDGDGNERDDIDAVSLLGLDLTEWRVKAVRSQNSGDDGFDVTNSSIALDSLTVVNSAEDGVNVTSSIVQIRRSLTVAMSPSISPDRQLFDLEVKAGATRIAIDRRAYVDLRGSWGSVYNEVNLNSLDMPAPPRRGTTSQWYVYAGMLSRGPALVYSTIAD
jgi:hypothetical protein